MPGRGRLGVWFGFLFLVCLNGFAAGPHRRLTALGSITGTGEVWVDNQPAAPGTSLFAGDVISTGKASKAVMSLRAGTVATLVESSEVVLSWDTSPTTLSLHKGALVVRNEGQQPTRVSVLGATVVMEAQSGFPAICRIASLGRSAAVFADSGRVEIHGTGAPLILSTGKYAKLEAGKAQGAGAGQEAGKVSSAIPDEVVQRLGKGAEVQLKLADLVYWEDVVRTMKVGRVRLELLDGSFLNVGARSLMRITKHDPQTQQTEVELTLGRMRGEVVKLTKAGSNFQVRTQTAVIGVVGTIFTALARARLTRVYCIDGLLSVRNINPAVAGVVTLRAGQFTSVGRGLPPTGALRAPANAVRTEMAQTNLPGPTPAAAAAAGPGVGGGAAPGAGGGVAGAASTVQTVSSVTTVAASATGATLSGVALSQVSSAESTLDTATATLADAATTSNEAAAAASTAAVAAGNVDVGVQTVIALASPSGPGCGCAP